MTETIKKYSRHLTCPSCGITFSSWRSKRFCSETCRKKAANHRFTAKSRYASRVDAEAGIIDLEDVVSKAFSKPKSRYEGLRLVNGRSPYETPVFLKIDDCTQKAVISGEETIAWLMDVEGYGWFGKIKEPTGHEWTYGPATLKEAKEAVIRYLQGNSTDQDDDRSRYGSIYFGDDPCLTKFSVPSEKGPKTLEKSQKVGMQLG